MAFSRLLSFGLAVLACLAVDVSGQLDVNNAENHDGVPVVTVDSLPWLKPVTINCNMWLGSNVTGDDKYPDDSVPDQWLLPRVNDVIPIVGKGERYENVMVSSDAMNLTITNITEANFGLYHCMRTTEQVEGGYYLVRIGVNTNGPYFQDIWTLWYKKDTFQGLFGFTISIAIISSVAVIYGMIEGSQEEKSSDGSDAKKQEFNLAFVPDSNNDIEVVKVAKTSDTYF